MRKPRSWVLAGTLLLAALVQRSSGDPSVGLMARVGQIITSSTMQWASWGIDRPSNQLKYAVEAARTVGTEQNPGKPIYICRARHEGVLVPGQLGPKYKECVISLLRGVHRYPNFEILQNIERGALLDWKTWARYQEPFVGTVVGGSTDYLAYVARVPVQPDQGFTHYVGKMEPESFGVITVLDNKDNEIRTENGEILVETEPLNYVIKDIEFDHTKEKTSREPEFVLGTLLLSNEDEWDRTAATAFPYNFTYTLSWGQRHAISTGLNASIILANGTELGRIEWGASYTSEREELLEVSRFLNPGTACNVTIVASQMIRDAPYKASLVTFYPGGHEPRIRTLHSEKLESGLLEVAAIYSDVYFIGNNSLVPTTTTTTTTTTSTTTTTTPAPLPPDSVEENEVANSMTKKSEYDPKDENSSIQQDEANAGKLAKEDSIKQAAVGGLNNKPSSAVELLARFNILAAALISILIL